MGRSPRSAGRCGPIRCSLRGITLTELVIALAIAATLAAIVVPTYTGYVRDARTRQAIADIEQIEVRIERFRTNASRLPDALAEAGADGILDPWGNPYRYLRIEGAGLKGKGSLRKDKNLVPVNSDFDLYSTGPDGETKPPFTAKAARDDIVRCRNGAWIGEADSY